MNSVWCCIPTYNNAATIADVARRCRRQMDRVLVIDDGSTDADVRELLKDLDVTVVRHESNLGKGAAIMTALRFAAEHGAQYVLTIDGDGQHFPEDIPDFLSRLSPDAILLGARERISGDMPPASVFGRDFSDFWVCIECGANLRDTQSGFRVYPVKHLLNLPLKSRHYNFEIEALTRGVWAGLGVASIPIHVWYPKRNQRISSFRPFMDNLRLSLLHARLAAQLLLPISHRRLVTVPRPRLWLRHFWSQNSSPLGLATAVALTVLLCILLWPWGPIAAAYLALRWHLNKLIALASMIVCMTHALPDLCIRVGQSVLEPNVSPFLVWYVGSHIVAFSAAPVLAVLVYVIARQFRAVWA